MDKVKNIVVLCGGTSSERAISLISGEQVCRALRSLGRNARLLDVFIGHEGATAAGFFEGGDYEVSAELDYIKNHSENIEEIKKERRSFFGPEVMEICAESDLVFMALHGANGEDGRVQAAFDLSGIKYTGCDYLSSAVSMNKNATKKIFKACKVPCAGSFAVKKNSEIILPAAEGLDYPVVVKANCGGSSIGVYIVNGDDEYKNALDEVFCLEDEAVVEKFVAGREFSVGVIAYEPLPVIEIIPKQGFYNYENKYKAGATIEQCPADVSEDIEKKIAAAAKKAAVSLGLSVYCRVDVMMDADFNCYCLEANTLPGMTPTSLLPQEAAVVGMDFPALCERLVEVSMEKY